MVSRQPEKIKSMFNGIAGDYDKLNNLMTFGLHKFIKKSVISKIPCKKPLKILDLCTGTGDMAVFLSEKFPDAHVVGVDFSDKMLEIAKKRPAKIDFSQADCTDLPYEDETFDICVISFGLRNVENLNKVISEIFRVLKKGGIFVNIDLGKPDKFFNLFLKPYMYLWVAILGKVFHGDEIPYKYLAESNETFPSPDDLCEKYKEAGFLNSRNFNYLFGQVSSQISQK